LSMFVEFKLFLFLKKFSSDPDLIGLSSSRISELDFWILGFNLSSSSNKVWHFHGDVNEDY